MKQIKIEQDARYGDVFALVKLPSGTYVCPGWHRVPEGTARHQILMMPILNKTPDYAVTSVIKKAPVANKKWNVEGSKPGTVYEVTNKGDRWSCTCPSANFHRGDCKHIKKLKAEVS